MSKREEVREKCRELLREDLYLLLLSVSYSGYEIEKNGNVARIGDIYIRFWWGKLRQKSYFENPELHGRIFEWVFKCYVAWERKGDNGAGQNLHSDS